MAHVMGVQKEIPKIELELGSMHLFNSFFSRRLAPFQDILANYLLHGGSNVPILHNIFQNKQETITHILQQCLLINIPKMSGHGLDMQY